MTNFTEPVRKHPKGIKVLSRTEDKIRLRFRAFRADWFIPLACLAAPLFIGASMTAIGLTGYGGPVFRNLLISWVIFGLLFYALGFTKVTVVITKKWMRFGDKYYDMNHVGTVRIGATASLQSKTGSSVIPLNRYSVSYGRWGEQTSYMNTDKSAFDFALYVTYAIESMREHKSTHASERGVRKQKF